VRRVVRSVRLAVPPAVAWEACIALLTAADPRRGILSRRCEPDPPRVDGLLVTTVAGPEGAARELVSRIVELAPPQRVATASEGEGPSVRTALEVTPESEGSRVTVTSEATTGLSPRPGLARLLDGVILGRSQRRAARATLRQIRELAQRSGRP
jgi:polyketide cyclase/dehydrase/lipid transport protein